MSRLPCHASRSSVHLLTSSLIDARRLCGVCPLKAEVCSDAKGIQLNMVAAIWEAICNIPLNTPMRPCRTVPRACMICGTASGCRHVHIRLKVRALFRATWPKGLHGIGSTTIGGHVLNRLRSGAMRGLQADGAGCSPWLHLGLVEHPICDPMYWAVFQTLRSVRDCAALDFVLPVLTRVSVDGEGGAANSITHTLVQRIHQLGWSVRKDGLLEGFLGPFCLFSTSLPELDLRAQFSWRGVVAQKVRHRGGLADPHLAHVQYTRRWLRGLPAEEACLARKLLNGAHFTGEAKQDWQHGSSDLCGFCQCSDSRFHRFWQCDAFAPLRATVDPRVWAMIPYLPEFLTCYGWGLKPACWKPYMQALLNIHETPTQFGSVLPTPDGWIDLFTDGSCHSPTESWRLASWAVIQANPSFDMIGCPQSTVVAASPLPGLLQSAFRAEVRAVLEALRVAAHCKPNSRHSDLWGDISALIQELGPAKVQITKVAAHQCALSSASAFEAWCFLHNGLVDHAATAAHFLRSHDFWGLHERFRQDTQFARWITGQVHDVLMVTSRAVVQQQIAAEEPSDAEVLIAHGPREPVWRPLPEVTWVPLRLCCKYGQRIVVQTAQWFLQAMQGTGGTVRWISFYQLDSDFMLCTGEGGPLKLEGWIDPAHRPAVSLLGISFKTWCRWYTHFLKELWTEWGFSTSHHLMRPQSEFLLLHTSCAFLPWSDHRLDCFVNSGMGQRWKFLQSVMAEPFSVFRHHVEFRPCHGWHQSISRSDKDLDLWPISQLLLWRVIQETGNMMVS